MDKGRLLILRRIYIEYNETEEEPDSVDTFDTVNYLLELLGYDAEKDARNRDNAT